MLYEVITDVLQIKLIQVLKIHGVAPCAFRISSPLRTLNCTANSLMAKGSLWVAKIELMLVWPSQPRNNFV